MGGNSLSVMATVNMKSASGETVLYALKALCLDLCINGGWFDQDVLNVQGGDFSMV